jgi:regulatory protein
LRTEGAIAPESAGDPDVVRQAALRLLERSRRTRSDLERRLLDRGYTRGAVDEVVARLQGVGLVDDVEFARAFLAGRWGAARRAGAASSRS